MKHLPKTVVRIRRVMAGYSLGHGSIGNFSDHQSNLQRFDVRFQEGREDYGTVSMEEPFLMNSRRTGFEGFQ